MSLSKVRADHFVGPKDVKAQACPRLRCRKVASRHNAKLRVNIPSPTVSASILRCTRNASRNLLDPSYIRDLIDETVDRVSEERRIFPERYIKVQGVE